MQMHKNLQYKNSLLINTYCATFGLNNKKWLLQIYKLKQPEMCSDYLNL